MATATQMHANHSGTGDRLLSPVKSGFDAASHIIPGEDPNLLAQLASQYYAECQPEGPTEIALVDTIVQASWNMRRFARIENQLFVALVSAQGPGDHALGAAYLADAAGAGALQKIFRRQQAAQRDWYKARTELRRLQEERAAFPVPVPAQLPVTRPEPLPASPPVVAAPAHPRPVPGKNWVGSEPPEWRL
jgi:hypothetical protein